MGSAPGPGARRVAIQATSCSAGGQLLHLWGHVISFALPGPAAGPGGSRPHEGGITVRLGRGSLGGTSPAKGAEALAGAAAGQEGQGAMGRGRGHSKV